MKLAFISQNQVSRDKLPVLDHFRFRHAPLPNLRKPETEVVQNRQFIPTRVELEDDREAKIPNTLAESAAHTQSSHCGHRYRTVVSFVLNDD